MFLQKKNIPVALAAPSWVFPGNIAANCAFLAGKVNEVGLLFLDSAQALAYGEEDLPRTLARLPLGWHAHLPCDLDISDQPKAAATCLTLMDKLGFLGVKRAVLHPPRRLSGLAQGKAANLENFMADWRRSGRASRDLLLENLPEHNPAEFMAMAKNLDASICLDLAHYLLAGGTAENLPKGFMRRVRLLHLCAPAPGPNPNGRHRPLTALDEAGHAAGIKICREAGPETVFMLELFAWEDFTRSLPVLEAWIK